MVKNEYEGMMKKDIKDMTIAEYMEYEAEMKRQPWKNARFYYPTNRDSNSLSHDRSRVLGYEHHSDDLNVNAYLPPLIPCFKPVQPPTKNMYEPLEENTDVVSEDESEIVKQEMGTDTDDDKPFMHNPQHEDEDVDEWLNAEMEKRMYEEGDISGALPCQLLPKEFNPGSFTLPSTIGDLNLYVMADLGANVNVVPKSIFEHLKLASLKETSMVVEMADMTKKDPLGIVENILVKIDKFLFPSDFVIIDMPGEPNETVILGEDRIRFDMDRGVSHPKIPVEKIYMASSVHEEEYFNPLEIKNDVFSYESPACLLFKKHTQSCDNESIDTLGLAQEFEECGKDCGMWPTYNPDLSFCGGYDAIYGKGENGMLKQWMCFQDHKRQSVGANRMVFTDFLKLIYGNKVIEDTTHERRYYKWVVQDSEFNDNGVAHEATIDNNPYSFDVEIDYGKILDDPYSRRFDEYKEQFDSKIKQLANEYDLRVGMKKYAMYDIWEKCERFQDIACHWHDEGFKEDEQWESGIKNTCYTPPFVKSETFEDKRYSFKNKKSFVSITKELDDAQPLGRVNGYRFVGMIRKEMDEEGRTSRKT
ncbi:phospholipase-like protein [Tanacetum coccineum]